MDIKTPATITRFYFAYGSNMNTSRMEERIMSQGGVFSPPVLGRLRDYRLEFCKGPNAFANILRAANSIVYGYAYKMDNRAFELLDGFEGCKIKVVVPNGYQPSWRGHYYRMACLLEVEIDGAWVEVEAIAYKAHGETVQARVKPPGWYLDHLLQGRPLLPPDYYENIKALASKPSVVEEGPEKGQFHPGECQVP